MEHKGKQAGRITPCAIWLCLSTQQADARDKETKDREIPFRPHSTRTHTHTDSRLSGEQDEKESVLLLDYPPLRCLMQRVLLGEAEEELGVCSQIASAERQERLREREGGEMRREW